MTQFHEKLTHYGMLIASIISLILISNDAFASEGSGGWRSTYDKVMLVVNFAIIVFLFIKFAKNPLKDFLANRKLEIAREIQRIEDQKKNWIDKIQSAKKDLDESDERFERIKQRIIQQGEKKRQDIIDGAKKQGQVMLNMAKRKINNDIIQAKNMLRSELVDSAVDFAMEKLPGEMNQEDKDKFIEQYLANISKK